jgi:hypothetical protein
MAMSDRERCSGGVLRLRKLTMIENIRRAGDPAWRERLERQQVVARLGRMFGRAEDPQQAMHDHAQALKAELRPLPLPSRSFMSREEPDG